jgi:hypothetical protein
MIILGQTIFTKSLEDFETESLWREQIEGQLLDEIKWHKKMKVKNGGYIK